MNAEIGRFLFDVQNLEFQRRSRNLFAAGPLVMCDGLQNRTGLAESD
jgi:hypothetical protein